MVFELPAQTDKQCITVKLLSRSEVNKWSLCFSAAAEFPRPMRFSREFGSFSTPNLGFKKKINMQLYYNGDIYTAVDSADQSNGGMAALVTHLSTVTE